MAVYRLEAWLSHGQPDVEDELEERVMAAFRAAGVGFVAGPVVFRIFPNGDPGAPW